MIRGGGGKSSGYSADLMVCFPSRTHLSLPSKSISSPSSALNRRQSAPPHHHHRRSFSKLSGSGGVRQSRGREIAEEPTSPKVTCAGQIKVRPSKRGGGGGKNWQSLMAEIEKIHRSKSESKFLGIKKDVMGFLTCLRDFDFRCFGAFPPVDAISDQEEEEDNVEEEYEDDEDGGSVMKTYSGTVFSDWLTFLHEKQNVEECVEAVSDKVETAVPPPNALLLMRCRSAPVKNWLEKEEEKKIECEDTRKQKGEEEKETVSKKKDLRSLMEEEEEDVNVVVRDYDTNYYKLSSDIAKETWVVSGGQDSLYRSRSWNL
ncbi:Nucleolar GTP-binding protein [Hirschfeldia incana]|nr:Nucleolar GTP-binding protein [Hirschfeldia incana]